MLTCLQPHSQQALGWDSSRHCISQLVCSHLSSSITQCRFLCCSKEPLCFIILFEKSLEGSFGSQQGMPFLGNGVLGLAGGASGGSRGLRCRPRGRALGREGRRPRPGHQALRRTDASASKTSLVAKAGCLGPSCLGGGSSLKSSALRRGAAPA